MPILKTAVKLGGAAALVNLGLKALDRHEKTRTETDSTTTTTTTNNIDPQPQQQIHSSSVGSAARPVSRAGIGYSSSSYAHQSYCNGTGGGQCHRRAQGQMRGRSVSPRSPPSYEYEPVCGGEVSEKGRSVKS